MINLTLCTYIVHTLHKYRTHALMHNTVHTVYSHTQISLFTVSICTLKACYTCTNATHTIFVNRIVNT